MHIRYIMMNFVLLLLTICIAMAVNGRDLIQTSPSSRLRMSTTKITINSEGKKINNNFFYSQKNSFTTNAAKIWNKMWIKNFFGKKFNGSDKVKITTPRVNIETKLIQPKLRQCLGGMVRDINGECISAFEDS